MGLLVKEFKIVKSLKSPTFWASRPNPEVTQKSRNTFGNPEFREMNSFGSVSGYKIVTARPKILCFDGCELTKLPLYVICFVEVWNLNNSKVLDK